MISALAAGFVEGPAPPLDEDIASLSADIDRFTEAASREDVPIERKVRLLRGAMVARNRLDSVISNLTREVDEDSLRHVDGGAACARWLRDECRMSGSAAYAQVRLARQLPEMPDTARAFASGALSAPHASAIARTVERVVRYGGSGKEAEGLMLRQAARRDPTDLLRFGFGLRHQLCPDDLADEEEDQREHSWIDLIQNRDGTFSVSGELDKEAGTIVKTAIHAVNGKRANDDHRTHRQRRAAGLVELARYRLDAGDLPTRGGQRPHITVTTTLETKTTN